MKLWILRLLALVTIAIVINASAVNLFAQSSDGEQVKYALVMKALSNPFFAKMCEGAKQYAAKHDLALDVFGVQRETDIDRQIAIVDDLIDRGYKAIVIAPADSKRLVGVCKKAADKGIAVINIDNPLDKQTMKSLKVSIPFVGSDNFEGASLVGTAMAKKLSPNAKVIIIEGIRGVKNADLRAAGFKDALLANNDQVEVVASESANWHTDEAFALTVRLFQQHSGIEGIFCANDQMAIGALKALDVLGRSGKVIVGGYDNIPAVRGELSAKRMFATVEQHPELMGQYGLRLAAEAVSGKPIAEYTSTPLDMITSGGFGRKIGLSISEQGVSFFDELSGSIKDMAAMYGAEIIVKDAERSDAKQIVDISELVKQKVDVLIVNPVHSASISAPLELAKAAGIKIITVDRAVTGIDVACHITSDNVAGGKMAGEFLARKTSQKARIIEIAGLTGTSATHERGEGFGSVIREYPQMEIIETRYGEFDREKAHFAMEYLLTQNVQFDAIFAHNDLMALGAAEALKHADVKEMPIIIGFDAIPEAIKAIRAGILTATVAQMPENMGKAAINIAMQLLDGEDVPKKVMVDLKVVSR